MYQILVISPLAEFSQFPFGLMILVHLHVLGVGVYLVDSLTVYKILDSKHLLI